MKSDLPKGWISTPLNQIFEPRNNRVSPADLHALPYVGLEQVEAHTNKLLGTIEAKTMLSKATQFFAGDVLYGRMRPYLSKVVLLPFDGLASTEFIIFPEIKGVNNRFLHWRLSASDFVSFACSQYEGDRPRVKFDQLGKFQLNLPPYAEQNRIVEKLEVLLLNLDASVVELEAAQVKLTQYRQSLLKAAVEGALTAEWRETQTLKPDETSAKLLKRILSERRIHWEAQQITKFKKRKTIPPTNWQAKYPEPVAPKAIGLPELPLGWVWVSMDMLGEVVSGVAKGTKRDVLTVMREVPYLRVANVQRGYLDLADVKTIFATENDIAALTLRSGDVLFNEGGDRDKLGRGWVWADQIDSCIHQNHVYRLRPSVKDIVPELISHHGNSFGKQWFQRVGKQTTNLASINIGLLREFPVPLAPVNEQIEIVKRLNSQLESLSSQEKIVEISLRKSIAQRQKILQAAFAGQLVPQNQADEPASVLLERIKTERVAREMMPKMRKNKVKKEVTEMASNLVDVLTAAGDWMTAQEAFRHCGVADDASTDVIEVLYAELRELVKTKRLLVESVTDTQGRKICDRLKLIRN